MHNVLDQRPRIDHVRIAFPLSLSSKSRRALWCEHIHIACLADEGRQVQGMNDDGCVTFSNVPTVPAAEAITTALRLGISMPVWYMPCFLHEYCSLGRYSLPLHLSQPTSLTSLSITWGYTPAISILCNHQKLHVLFFHEVAQAQKALPTGRLDICLSPSPRSQYPQLLATFLEANRTPTRADLNLLLSSVASFHTQSQLRHLHVPSLEDTTHNG